MKELGETTGGGGGGSGRGEGSSVGVRAVSRDEILREPTPPALVVSALAAGGSGVESTRREAVPPEAVKPRALKELPVGGGEGSGDGVELSSGREGWQGAGAEECGRGGSGGGRGRAASLTARLEFLALQTQQLLADGSDTPCSSSDDDFG